MYHTKGFIHTMFKIATKMLMIRKSLYLISKKCKNRLEKEKPVGWQDKLNIFYPLGLINEKGEYLF